MTMHRAGPGRLGPAVLLAFGWLSLPPLASVAVAQSDAGTVTATVTVNAAAFTVTGIADLTFGSHFAVAGTVQNEAAALWSVDPGGGSADVDLAMTQLPNFLDNGSGGQVPLTYGATSLWAGCQTGVVQADPAVGIIQCELAPPGMGAGNVALGVDNGGGASDFVTVDLTGAAPGIYSATLELTATLN